MAVKVPELSFKAIFEQREGSVLIGADAPEVGADFEKLSLPKSLIRGTDAPCMVDKGGWLSLYEESRRARLSSDCSIDNGSLPVTRVRRESESSLTSSNLVKALAASFAGVAFFLVYEEWRSGAVYVSGTDSDDEIFGGRGPDLLYGMVGDDQLYGGRGSDTIFGGDGNDTIFGGRGYDEIFGGEGNDSIIAGRGQDIIDGRAGNDQLYGGLGADTFVFVAGSGQDTIEDFEVGMDMLMLGAGQEIVSFTEVDADMVEGVDGTLVEFSDGSTVLLSSVVGITSFDDLL